MRMGVPMGVVVWGYRGGVGTLRIPYKLSTYGGFRHSRGIWHYISIYAIYADRTWSGSLKPYTHPLKPQCNVPIA